MSKTSCEHNDLYMCQECSMSKMSLELNELRAENERLKDILRTDPDALVIRLSFGDHHIKSVIAKASLVRSTFPEVLISMQFNYSLQQLMGWVGKIK